MYFDLFWMCKSIFCTHIPWFSWTNTITVFCRGGWGWGSESLANIFEGTVTDSEFSLHSTFIHAILLPPLDRYRMQMTRFSFYDHDATQSECAHRLAWTQSVDKRAGPRFLSVDRILMTGLDFSSRSSSRSCFERLFLQCGFSSTKLFCNSLRSVRRFSSRAGWNVQSRAKINVLRSVGKFILKANSSTKVLNLLVELRNSRRSQRRSKLQA